MNTETVRAAILPAVEQIIKAVVGQVARACYPWLSRQQLSAR